MRPDVEWKLPEVVHPGKPFEVRVALVQKGGTKIHGVALRVLGETTDRGASSATAIFERRVVLEGEPKTLPERAEFHASFTLDEDAPSSSALEGVTWWACVEAAIPWWPDLDARTALHVRGRDTPTKSAGGRSREKAIVVAPPPTPRAPRRIFTGERPPPRPIQERFSFDGGVELEVSLEDAAFAPGDVVRGRIALGGIVGHDVYTLELHVGRWERHSDDRGNDYLSFVSYLQLLQKTSEFFEGMAIDFDKTLPDETPIGDELMFRVHFEYDRHSLWRQLPVVVGGFAPRDGDDAALPVVGNDRWREAWREVARDKGFDVDVARFTLRGAAGDVPIAIALHPDALRAELHWSKLGLDLRIARARGLSFSKPHVGSRAFRDDFRVTARDRAQAESFLSGRVIDAIEALRIDEIDDDHGVFADDVSSAHDLGPLASFVARVIAVASAVRAERDRMPPPTGTAHAARLWRAWAKRTESAFDVARLAVGPVRREGGAISLCARFDEDGAVDGVVVRLADDRTFAGEVPDELRARMAGVVRVEPHAIVLERDALPDDPSSLEDAFAAMEEAAARLSLDGPHGPYR